MSGRKTMAPGIDGLAVAATMLRLGSIRRFCCPSGIVGKFQSISNRQLHSCASFWGVALNKQQQAQRFCAYACWGHASIHTAVSLDKVWKTASNDEDSVPDFIA